MLNYIVNHLLRLRQLQPGNLKAAKVKVSESPQMCHITLREQRSDFKYSKTGESRLCLGHVHTTSCRRRGRASLNRSYNAPKHLPQGGVVREAHCATTPEALRLHAVHVSNAHSRHDLVCAATRLWYGDGPLAVVYSGVPTASSLPYVYMPDIEGLIY